MYHGHYAAQSPLRAWLRRLPPLRTLGYRAYTALWLNSCPNTLLELKFWARNKIHSAHSVTHTPTPLTPMRYIPISVDSGVVAVTLLITLSLCLGHVLEAQSRVPLTFFRSFCLFVIERLKRSTRIIRVLAWLVPPGGYLRCGASPLPLWARSLSDGRAGVGVAHCVLWPPPGDLLINPHHCSKLQPFGAVASGVLVHCYYRCCFRRPSRSRR